MVGFCLGVFQTEQSDRPYQMPYWHPENSHKHWCH